MICVVAMQRVNKVSCSNLFISYNSGLWGVRGRWISGRWITRSVEPRTGQTELEKWETSILDLIFDSIFLRFFVTLFVCFLCMFFAWFYFPCFLFVFRGGSIFYIFRMFFDNFPRIFFDS